MNDCKSCKHFRESGINGYGFCKAGDFDMIDLTACIDNYQPKTKTETKTMNNRIEISHNETADGRVIVTAIKMLTQDEIAERYGAEVRRLYFKEGAYCYRYGSAILHTSNRRIEIGEDVSSKYFDEVIEQCREAGKRLAEIRRQVKAYETKTIII